LSRRYGKPLLIGEQGFPGVRTTKTIIIINMRMCLMKINETEMFR
jgi:hypothetical protein